MNSIITPAVRRRMETLTWQQQLERARKELIAAGIVHEADRLRHRVMPINTRLVMKIDGAD